MNFFANEFDYENYGISNINQGNFFKKKEYSDVKLTKNLCVINFLEPTSNIAKPVVKYHRVINLFKDILFNLKFVEKEKIKSGLLNKVLEKVNKINYY